MAAATAPVTPEQQQQQQQQQRKRAHKACLNCRRRKAKCELDQNVSPPNSICKRCKEEGSICEIPTIERRGGFTNVLAGKERRRLQELLKSRSAQNVSILNSADATQGLLNNAWGDMNMKQTKSARSFSMSLSSDTSPTASDVIRADYNQEESTDPALGVPLEFTASSAPAAFDSGFASNGFRKRGLNEETRLEPSSMPASNRPHAPRHPHTYLQEAQIVIDGVIDAEDIPELVSFFFSHMAPFFHQFVPREYQNMRRLAREPAILVVICTIAAKARLQESYSEQHRRLWAYCKQVVSGAMWECPDDQVQSLIYAVLLLSEWLPGAMYLDTDKNVTGVDAIKRYTRICWPLIGQAVRLARYAGLLENDVQAFITLHLSDHLLACRLGCQPMLGQLFEVDAPMPLAASVADRARRDILKIMHLSNRMLYGSSATQDIIRSGQYLSLFHMLLTQLEQWRVDYAHFTDCKTFQDRVIMCEFHHVPLHTFSLAIVPWQERQHLEKQHGKAAASQSPIYENLIGLEESRKFVDIASDSARFMVEHIEDPSNPVNLRYAPIQWIMRLLYSGVFLAKTLLVTSLHPTKERQKNTIRVIRKAVEVLRSSAPGKYDPYCDLLEAICDQVLSGSTGSASHISELERLQQEYKAQKELQTPPPQKPLRTASSSVDIPSMHRYSHNAHSQAVSPTERLSTRPSPQSKTQQRRDSMDIPISHTVPPDQPAKSRRLDSFSPPLSPGKSQWVLEPAVVAETEHELESESEREVRAEPEVASLEFSTNTIDEVENIWDFLGDTNFLDLGASPTGVPSMSL